MPSRREVPSTDGHSVNCTVRDSMLKVRTPVMYLDSTGYGSTRQVSWKSNQALGEEPNA